MSTGAALHRAALSGPPALPAAMRAAVLHEDGTIGLENIPVPRPKAREALIKVEACGVCHTDLHVIKNEVAFPKPCVLGHEISGIVVELGAPDQPGPSVGDRVVGGFIMPCEACDACMRGRDDLCSNFFEQNRLRGTLYDGSSRLSREDGTPLAMYSMAGLAEYCVCPVGALAAVHELTDGRGVDIAFEALGRAETVQHGLADAARAFADLAAGKILGRAVIAIG